MCVGVGTAVIQNFTNFTVHQSKLNLPLRANLTMGPLESVNFFCNFGNIIAPCGHIPSSVFRKFSGFMGDTISSFVWIIW